jgi:hypothetical protein
MNKIIIIPVLLVLIIWATVIYKTGKRIGYAEGVIETLDSVNKQLTIDTSKTSFILVKPEPTGCKYYDETQNNQQH